MNIFKEIKEMQRKEKRAKILYIISIVFFALMFTACMALLAVLMPIYEDTVKAPFIAIPLIAGFIISIILFIVFISLLSKGESSSYNLFFDYLAKLDFSSMRSTTYKELRSYIKKNKILPYSYSHRKRRTIIKYDFGYAIEGTLGYAVSNGNGSSFLSLINGVTYIFEMKSIYDFVYVKVPKLKRGLCQLGYKREKLSNQEFLLTRKNQIRESDIMDVVEKLKDYFKDQYFFIKCLDTHVFVTIERPYFFEIDDRKTIMEYQSVFEQFENEVSTLREKLEYIISLNMSL